ncbi:MAG: TonB family protein [Janthinobacterium lividum]
MKPLFKNSTLNIAIAVSLLVHGLLLAVHFSAPPARRLAPVDPGIEVILVNAKHDKAPLKADALAQANLDGGGNADDGRAKSPLPDLRKVEDGDALAVSQRRIAQLEAQQQQIIAQTAVKTALAVPRPDEKEVQREKTPQAGTDATQTTHALARMEAEISRSIEEYNKRPKKTQITPSTREVGYAMYYSALQKKVENLGTVNFPQKDGQKLYGELVVYIPVFHDGTIYDKEGGPRIEKSSGNRALDAAALSIVRRAAPFGAFPPNMRSTDKDDVWEIITRFKFTREDMVETQLRGNNN